MTAAGRDPELAALLDRLVPPPDERADWRGLTDAAARPRRRRLAPALAAVLVVVAAPVTALAVTQGWWFFASGAAPKPLGPVSVVARGSWDGVGWTLSAYRSATDGLCFALTPAGKSGGALACNRIAGASHTRGATRVPPRPLTYLIGRDGHLPAYVAGMVVRSALTVDVVLQGGRTLTVRTLPAPTALRSLVRFYVARLPGKRSRVQALLGHGPHGGVVAYQPILAAAAVPAAEFGHMSNRGTLIHFSRSMRHRLRLMHRSAEIRLLATIGGRNLYMLGPTNAARQCFGSGKAVDPSTLPPTRTGVAELGGYTCSARTATTFPSIQQPIWDISIYGASRAHPQLQVLQLAGVASDGVKWIALLDAHGRLVRRVRVAHNVYALEHVPENVAIVAPADIDGRPIAFCGPNGGVLGTGTYVDARC